ncbi:TetR family transcriptional regulator [Microbacterium sp. EYE_512]|nr:TetR family transcriptional regulator [Microbacterium sp. EYE_512]
MRRKLDTARDIHRAALDLFEEQGVRDTTVAQIAERAGVSRRTFFRYFPTKELAGLPGQRRLLAAIAALRVTDHSAAAIARTVADAGSAAIGRSDDPELDEHRRVAALLATEPLLRAAASAQEHDLAVSLRERMAVLAPELDPLSAHLIAETTVAVWRVTWERWGELAREGVSADPADIYGECRARLAVLAGALGAEVRS